MKKLLSIITSVSLIASMASYGTFAAPSAVYVEDSAMFEVPMFDNEADGKEEAVLAAEGPFAADTGDSAFETDRDFGAPEILEEAFLFADLSGEGTKESPFLISSKEDLLLMANNVNTGIGNSACYKLTEDIDLDGAQWSPIGHYNSQSSYLVSFSGEFDGDGHTVSNFTITKDNTPFLGFFGYIYQGTVKNLNITGAVIDVTTSKTDSLYAGTLVGRIVANKEGGSATIENCNVSDSSVSIRNKGTIYAGGIAGSVAATGDTLMTIALTKSECDVAAVSTAEMAAPGGAGIHNVISGGIAANVLIETGAEAKIFNCGATGKVVADALGTQFSNAMAGGAFGSLQTYESGKTGGSLDIDSCYSMGEVVAKSHFYSCNAGGFAGQFFTTRNAFITDCFSGCDTAEQYGSKGNPFNYDPCAGGFVGVITWLGFSSSMPKTIINCYASGDAIDLTYKTTDEKDTSFVGGFAGWSVGCEENCYKLSSQVLTGSDIFSDTLTVLSPAEATLADKYTGFDFTHTWEIDADAEYPYPTLKEKLGFATFIVDGENYAVSPFGPDGKVKEVADPVKAPEIDKVYTFNYWSLSENGTAFNFGSDTLTKNTNLYAVFTSTTRKYEINFYNGSNKFVETQVLDYGSPVKAPSSNPSKAETEDYFYKFLYWSEIAEGEEYDFTGKTVNGDKAFYAVFLEIDKKAWTGGVADEFSSGYGTQSLPYVISTGDEFALFAKVINEKNPSYTSAYFKLGDDINLGGNYWVPVGNSVNHPFGANFDGCGYTVSNFKMASGQYGGLFGVVLNGKIKNLNVADFEIAYSIRSSYEKYPAYVGGLAAYVTSERGETLISGVKVTAAKFDVNAEVGYLYAGNIAGYASAYINGKTNITDCFATSPLKITNKEGYNYAGGIVGRLDTGSGSLARITRCYNIGSVTSSSGLHSSKAGGLVGYLYSYGSAYAPPPGQSGVDSDSSLSSDDASLFASDTDTMILDSFAVASVSSYSGYYDSIVGRVVGEVNTHAAVENSWYPSKSTSNVVISPVKETSVSGVTHVPHSSVKSLEWLSDELGFDFENTWTFIDGYDYPVLKCMVSDKPILKIVSASLDKGELDARIQVFSAEESYTVIIGVYNDRNQLIKLERKKFDSIKSAAEFDVSYTGLDKADYMLVSAVGTRSLKPLFEGIRYYV